MTSKTHYIIVFAFYDRKETDVTIIVGEEKFREYAFEHYFSTQYELRECTSHDIDQFLNHHDATYFDEKYRDDFEKIISKHGEIISEEKCHHDPEEYHPPKIDDFQSYTIFYGSMYRVAEKFVQTIVNLKTMKTDEIVKIMVDCGRQMIHDEDWGWYDIVVVEGSNLKVEKHDI